MFVKFSLKIAKSQRNAENFIRVVESNKIFMPHAKQQSNKDSFAFIRPGKFVANYPEL
jgi:hypothetical protein